jgi:arylsulfatase A-like enzyme
LAQVTLGRRKLEARDLAHINDLYDAEVAFTDAVIGELLGVLERRGFAQRTLVVIVADHGEELHDRNAYFYHSCSIYDSTLHIPLLMWWPGHLPSGRRVQTIVQSIDIAPTLLELLALPPLPVSSGQSLVPLIKGHDKKPDSAAFAEIGPHIRTIRTAGWRYVDNPTGTVPDCRPYRDTWTDGEPQKGDVTYEIANQELYDLTVDPNEVRNVAQEHPDVVADLKQRLTRVFADDRAAGDRTTVDEPDPDALEELRELGYIK